MFALWQSAVARTIICWGSHREAARYGNTSTDVTRRKLKPKPNKKRALVQVDHRYAIGRRVKELVAAFRTRIGPDADDPVTSTAIRRAAETTALSEDLRRLHLQPRKPSAPSFSEYLAARGDQP